MLDRTDDKATESLVVSNLPKDLPSTEGSIVQVGHMEQSEDSEAEENARGVSVDNDIGEDEGAGNATEPPTRGRSADEDGDGAAEEVVGESTEREEGVDDEPSADGSSDGSSELSLSDNEPDLTAGEYFRTRSGRATKRVDYGNLHKRGSQFVQQGSEQLRND